MCLLRSLVVALAMIVLSVPVRGRGDDGLEPHMTLSSVTLERTTLSEAQRLLGPAEVRHNGGDAAASASGACYVGADGTTLALISNIEMGGGTTITDVQLVARGAEPDFSSDDRYVVPPEHRPRCAQLGSLSEATATRGGLRLGMTKDDVVRLLGPPAESEDHRLRFASEVKVPMTPEQKEAFEAHNGPGGNDLLLFRARTIVIEFVGEKAAVIRLSQVTSS